MDPKCIYCGLGTLVRFACLHCTEDVKFYVCNRECQKKFWKHHKKQHGGFPSYFDEIGAWSVSTSPGHETAYKMQKIVKDLMPWRIMINLERADLTNDVIWFKEHWKAYKNGMVFHALASLGIFEWHNLCKWIQEISVNDDSANKALDLLHKHPGFGKKSDDVVYFSEPLSGNIFEYL